MLMYEAIGRTYVMERKIAVEYRFCVDISTDFYRSSQNSRGYNVYIADTVAGGGRLGRENETTGIKARKDRTHVARCSLRLTNKRIYIISLINLCIRNAFFNLI